MQRFKHGILTKNEVKTGGYRGSLFFSGGFMDWDRCEVHKTCKKKTKANIQLSWLNDWTLAWSIKGVLIIIWIKEIFLHHCARLGNQSQCRIWSTGLTVELPWSWPFNLRNDIETLLCSLAIVWATIWAFSVLLLTFDLLVLLSWYSRRACTCKENAVNSCLVNFNRTNTVPTKLWHRKLLTN